MFLVGSILTRTQIAILLTAALLVVTAMIIAFASFSSPPFSDQTPKDSPSNHKTLIFIKNVLLLDTFRYNITLKQCRTEEYNGYIIETGQYTLEAEDSILDLIYTIENNVLWSCSLYNKNGSVIKDHAYASINDAAIGFLTKYQNYTNIDSTKMIDMLSSVDPTKNATITSGSLKLTITHKDLVHTWFGDSVNFRWVNTYNGCDYLLVDLGFRDGILSNLVDHRQLYSIGDTTVNISMKQAIEIAMKRIQDYSYKMADDIWVSDFNVTGTKAELIPSSKERYILYPCWTVSLYLDKIYPGSVRGLLVHIWADSGEAFHCSNIAYTTPLDYIEVP